MLKWHLMRSQQSAWLSICLSFYHLHKLGRKQLLITVKKKEKGFASGGAVCKTLLSVFPRGRLRG
jgi:hypothetical protein